MIRRWGRKIEEEEKEIRKKEEKDEEVKGGSEGMVMK